MFRCPGQDQRFWKPADIFEVRCSRCGTSVEFFKDEPKLNCRNCGHVVANPKIDLGCAEWCQYAEQCVGVLADSDATALRDRLIDEMKSVFAGDQKRIEHSLMVLDYAEQIQQAEGADPFIVKAAAVLHDIGIAEAERKYGSAAAKYQQIEGPPIAEAILKRYGVSAAAIEHVCRIVGSHHSGNDLDTIEFNCVWDADWLVNMPDVFRGRKKSELQGIIERTLKTAKGRELANKLYVQS
jgi:putative nucleotidyltransferase with HDIG domain